MKPTYDQNAIEARMQALWESQGTYTFHKDARPVYAIDTPPPTVSGKLHIGHIFSYTQTDVLARFVRMSGFNVFYPFGFDDNGLPTERFVEKQRGITAHSVGRPEFIAQCLEVTHQVERDFEALWRSIALSVDWKLSYSTISDETRAISQASFLDLYRKGYVYRKDEPALYCTACRTSVAQAELEDVERDSYFNDIVFAGPTGERLIIGTTRPELLASCVALLYHPSDERYSHLKGKTARVPLYDFEVPIIEDDLVLPDKGTGLVMCCTFGDKTDVLWFKKHGFTYKQSIGFDGKMLPLAGPLAGLSVTDARAHVVELLEAAGLLTKRTPIRQVVSVYERSKREIEYLMLPQWFLKILPYKQDLIALADKIAWYPAYMKSRYVNWVEGLQWDWCLSRQRAFGIPFPVWYDATSGDVVCARPEDLPVDPQQAKPSWYAGEVRPDMDVMDTWNTSSLTPYLCTALYNGTREGLFDHPQEFLPMGMRPQAHDIIRTWAFYTMVKSWMHHGDIPWRSIVISGHVLSPQNQKISKSQGNNPLDPHVLLKTYSADVIRYWTASSTLGTDTAFSDTQLKIGNKLTVKLWNAFQFVREHMDVAALSLPTEPQATLNRWILSRLAQTCAEYRRYFEAHEFSLAIAAAERFFWHDLCDNYLELTKDQMFNPDAYTPAVCAETKATLARVFYHTLQLFAPVLAHLTEQLYQDAFREVVGVPSIHQTTFDMLAQIQSDDDACRRMDSVLAIVTAVRKAKSEAQRSLKTEIAELIVVDAAQHETRAHELGDLEQIIRGVTKSARLAYTNHTHHALGLHESEQGVVVVVDIYPVEAAVE